MSEPRYLRKVITIGAADSPNVALGLAEESRGLKPSHRVFYKGVLTYAQYQSRLLTWSPQRICIGLHGRFWEGAEQLLFPPMWMEEAHLYATVRPRPADMPERWLGVDTGAGGDESAWVVVDRHGVLSVESFRTPETSAIEEHTIAVMRRWDIPPANVLFDLGDGGKVVVSYMRKAGRAVRGVFFNDAVGYEIDGEGYDEYADTRRAMDVAELRSVYANRRAQMYGQASDLLDPARLVMDPDSHPFAIPREFEELRRQLDPLPKTYKEGRQYLIPKDKPGPNYTGQTIKDMLGRSPDQADAFVMAVHLMLARPDAPHIVLSTLPREKVGSAVKYTGENRPELEQIGGRQVSFRDGAVHVITADGPKLLGKDGYLVKTDRGLVVCSPAEFHRRYELVDENEFFWSK